MDRRLDCGACGRKVRGPWTRHATTDAHRRSTGPRITRVPIARVRRQNAGVTVRPWADPWAQSDDAEWGL